MSGKMPNRASLRGSYRGKRFIGHVRERLTHPAAVPDQRLNEISPPPGLPVPDRMANLASSAPLSPPDLILSLWQYADDLFAAALVPDVPVTASNVSGSVPVQPARPPMPEQDVRFIPREQRSPPRQPKPPVSCHNCGGPHPWRRCRQRLGRFCNLCGTRGVTKQTCQSDSCIATRELDLAAGRAASQLFPYRHTQGDLVPLSTAQGPSAPGQPSTTPASTQGSPDSDTPASCEPADHHQSRHLLDLSIASQLGLPEPITPRRNYPTEASDPTGRSNDEDPTSETGDASDDEIFQIFN